ncbi:hypothetical protein BDV96DRAFT_571307 [Lophiotrema nucula]|uniref:Actin-like ATPase domain-containing protein n=1 Tax=Lophiotrema nucula TaxID=690887 RepID=A0A6A5ZEY9_9PLEO|nr:hypothetical protein BDV96DRAFT_571307 [Lophiotrema nucula]
MPSKTIFVAVDFGTTFTGVAYSDPSDNRSDSEPLLFRQWNEEQDKVPTVLRYEDSSRSGLGTRSRGLRWGVQVKPGQSCHKWFKLNLEPTYLLSGISSTVDLSQAYPDDERDPALPDVSAKRLTTDFLTAVREHVERYLRQEYMTESGAEPRLKWMLTVPAVWTNEATNATRECARLAGMASRTQDLLLTSEPEAAFICASKSIPERYLMVGKRILVLDAGGGTVDIVTYKVREVQPHLKVEENLVPNGGKCGSVFINRVFEKMIDRKLNSVNPHLVLSAPARLEMMKSFETFIKCKYNGDDTEENISVNGLPDTLSLRIKGGFMEISREEMNTVMDVVVNQVLLLVKDQVQGVREQGDDVAAIVLVGGFGGSPYLRKRLGDDEYLGTIYQVRCSNPATAVVRGAVIKGLQDLSPHRRTVLSRKSVCSLGVTSSVPFRPGHHPESHKYEDSVHNEHLCKDVLSYFVRKNQDLSEDNPVEFSLERLVPIEGPFVFADVVYETYENEPPEILNDTCRALGSLDSDLSDVPGYLYERPGNGDFFKIRYKIKATFSSAGDVKVELDFNGTKHGSVRLRYGNSALFRPVRRD